MWRSLVSMTRVEVVPLQVLCAALHASRVLHQAVDVVPAQQYSTAKYNQQSQGSWRGTTGVAAASA
jgi:hypothetical protein